MEMLAKTCDAVHLISISAASAEGAAVTNTDT